MANNFLSGTSNETSSSCLSTTHFTIAASIIAHRVLEHISLSCLTFRDLFHCIYVSLLINSNKKRVWHYRAYLCEMEVSTNVTFHLHFYINV